MSGNVDVKLARSHGLTESEYQHIVDGLGRVPTLVELGILSVMWSEHCSYKSSRRHLKHLPTEAPWVLQGPGENAGVIDVGDGQAVAFKMESHNHPSFIEPYQGAATGVGGIMRDVFTMGARPIANLNSLRFGRLESPRMRFLLGGVVAGIGGYGNCMGVPTVGGEIAFDPSYDGNILVNAFTLGVLPSDRIFRSAAGAVGSPVVYVGSKTGRDGIHGATMASEEFGKESEEKRPRVQVGDPFTEKKLLEACLELMQKDVIVAIQDMGAAGLTSSSCEMASRGGKGIEIDVERVPRRETGMNAYEVMLSESQERMLMVVKDGTFEQVRAIFEKWDLSVAVIGHITDSQRVVIKEAGQVVADLPVGLIVDDAPSYDRPQQRPNLEARWTLPKLNADQLGPRLLSLLARPTIASKRLVYEQYDSSVRAATIQGPGRADAAVVRLPDHQGAPSATQKKGVAMSADMNGRYCQLDPRRGALLGVLEAARNLACVGAEPKGLTDCLNFGNPEKPEVMWSFVECIHGLAEGCRALGVPVVSGNVSLYNETEGRAILPTPSVVMVGLIDDVARTAPMGFADPGDRILLLGSLERLGLGGSELVAMETAELLGRPAEPHLPEVLATHRAAIELVRAGLVKSAHDVAEGGVLVALAESCVAGAGRFGAEIDLPGKGELLARAFGEGASVIVVSAAPERVAEVLAMAKSAGAVVTEIGTVGGERLIWPGHLSVPVAELHDAWANGLGRALAAV